MFRKFVGLVLLSTLISCSDTKVLSEEFKTLTEGKYLFNSDETIDVSYLNNEMLLKWRGAENIKPLQVDDSVFFVKEMNEKITFRSTDSTTLLVFIPKSENDTLVQSFKKLADHVKVPSEYLALGEFDKAVEGYKKIQANDSLDPAIEEAMLNLRGYRLLRRDQVEEALDVFKINAALYPDSQNVYDSLGEAYLKSGDTINAIENYTKSLALDSSNKRAERQLKRLTKEK